MLKNSFFTLLTIPVIIYSAGLIEHTFKFDAPVIVNDKMYMGGCEYSQQLFAPEVAVKPVVLALGKDQKAVFYELEYGELVTLKGQFHIRPLRPDVSINSKPHPDLLKLESEIYSKNQFYPGFHRSNRFIMQYKNGIPLFVALLNPVQFNPVTGEVQYYKDISIKVQAAQSRSQELYQCTPAIKSMLLNLVDNKEAVAGLPLTERDGDDYEYLIVSRTTLKDNWGSLVEFNKRRCLRTKIQTMDYIKSNMTGRDNADKLRNYIIQEYKNHGIVYVVLGGDVSGNDAANVPDRLFRAAYYDHHVAPEKYYDIKDIAADMYFACLDGTWKTDSNGVEKQYYGDVGTEDFYWEVYASRMPVQSTTDLNNIINKTIKYSEQPVTEGLTNILLCGNYLWTNNGVDVYGDEHMDEYLGVCTNNTYTTYGFPTDVWKSSKLYERTTAWTVTDFRNRVSTFKPSFIEHEGHGNYDYAFLETNNGVTTTNYKNNGVNANFFILSTGACYPGDFNNSSTECIMENFLEKLPTGAVATQAFDPTGLEDDDGTDGSGQRIRRFFHDAIFNPQKGMHYLEMAHSNGKEANAKIMLTTTLMDPPYHAALRFISYGFNVFGDPALSVWTKNPQTLQPVFALTGNVFTSDIKNPLTWVALCDKDGNIVTTQLTGVDGKCKIDDQVLTTHIQNNPGTKMKVRMKAHNFYPYEGDLDIPTPITGKADALSFTAGFDYCGKMLTIKYNMAEKARVTISLYNAKGLLIKSLVNKTYDKGNYIFTGSVRGIGTGVYYCKMHYNNTQYIRKILIAE